MQSKNINSSFITDNISENTSARGNKELSRIKSKYFLQVKQKKIDDYTYEDEVVEISFKGFLNYIICKLKLI